MRRAGYPVMLVVSIGLVGLIMRAGDRLPLSHLAPSGFTGSHAESHVTAQLLFSLAVIMLTAQLVGALFRRLGQPTVMGEVLGGLLLGPSFLGWIWPEAHAFVLPESVVGPLGSLARIGVILYMFFVGLELNGGHLRHRAGAAVAISHASILVPFVLGAAIALVLYPKYGYPDVPFQVFALFMGISLSVTAFPVLARILTDKNLQGTALGVLALSCAAVDDATAWCLLAVVIGVARSDMSGVVSTFGWLLVYLAFMFTAVRLALRKLVRHTERAGRITAPVLGLFLLLMVASAWCTETIGIHALFGAFLVGALIPHDSLIAREARTRLYDISAAVFLPAFFALTGMRTQVGLVSDWGLALVVLLAACAGKFGGTYVAARLTDHNRRDSAELGILMNTRGLMELIVLNLGLEMKVLSPPLFTILVLMALVTTFMTSPVLSWLHRKRPG